MFIKKAVLSQGCDLIITQTLHYGLSFWVSKNHRSASMGSSRDSSWIEVT